MCQRLGTMREMREEVIVKAIYIKFKKLSWSEKIELVVVMFSIFASLCIVILDYMGLFQIDDKALLQVIILQLDLIVGVVLIERYGILKNIFENVGVGKTFSMLSTREQIESLYPLKERWEDATEVRIVAMANTAFLRGTGLDFLQEAVQRGVKIHMVCLEPGSSLAQLYIDSKILDIISLPLENNIEYYQNMVNTSEAFKNNTELRFCDVVLPYSMMIVRKDEEVKSIKVDLYAIDENHKNRRSFMVDLADSENINFYLSQWDKIWSGARPYNE